MTRRQNSDAPSSGHPLRLAKDGRWCWEFIVGVPAFSIVVIAVMVMISAGVVSALPRQNEMVLVPWSECVFWSVIVSPFLPWLLSLLLVKKPGRRIYILVSLAAATLLFWYFAGFEALLSKAYRRGL